MADIGWSTWLSQADFDKLRERFLDMQGQRVHLKTMDELTAFEKIEGKTIPKFATVEEADWWMENNVDRHD